MWVPDEGLKTQSFEHWHQIWRRFWISASHAIFWFLIDRKYHTDMWMFLEILARARSSIALGMGLCKVEKHFLNKRNQFEKLSRYTICLYLQLIFEIIKELNLGKT